jgi:hypothetical protein
MEWDAMNDDANKTEVTEFIYNDRDGKLICAQPYAYDRMFSEGECRVIQTALATALATVVESSREGNSVITRVKVHRGNNSATPLTDQAENEDGYLFQNLYPSRKYRGVTGDRMRMLEREITRLQNDLERMQEHVKREGKPVAEPVSIGPWEILPVPGGWVYTRFCENGTGGYDMAACFVPEPGPGHVDDESVT